MVMMSITRTNAFSLGREIARFAEIRRFGSLWRNVGQSQRHAANVLGLLLRFRLLGVFAVTFVFHTFDGGVIQRVFVLKSALDSRSRDFLLLVQDFRQQRSILLLVVRGYCLSDVSDNVLFG